MNATPERALNSIMEFGHVIAVQPDGSIEDAPADIWAPEVLFYGGEIDMCGYRDWELLSGFSGQWQYSGPLMHESEFVGGRLEDHIRSTPGYWACVLVPDIDSDPDGDRGCFDDAGWAIAFRPFAERTA